MSATTREWRTLAEDDPLFAVAAWPEKSGGRWTAEDFYAVGESDWKDFRARWEQYTGAPLDGTCLELGCGAGRITRPLTATFARVIAVDVSARMIELAESVCDAELHLVEDARLPLADGSVDAAFTCHVLQHLERLEAVDDSVRELHRVLRPGGTVMAHLLLEVAPDSILRRARTEARLRLVRSLNANRGAYSRVRRYRPDEVRAVLEDAGFADVELREFRVRSNDGLHAFWFGRRPAG
jgi:ubiquinone/menaquinone biosynthesis C-methylase UbiE